MCISGFVVDGSADEKNKTPEKLVTSSTQKLRGSDQNQCNKLITEIVDENWDMC